jgi:hypothetical protein
MGYLVSRFLSNEGFERRYAITGVGSSKVSEGAGEIGFSLVDEGPDPAPAAEGG